MVVWHACAFDISPYNQVIAINILMSVISTKTFNVFSYSWSLYLQQNSGSNWGLPVLTRGRQKDHRLQVLLGWAKLLHFRNRIRGSERFSLAGRYHAGCIRDERKREYKQAGKDVFR